MTVWMFCRAGDHAKCPGILDGALCGCPVCRHGTLVPDVPTCAVPTKLTLWRCRHRGRLEEAGA